MDRCDHDPVNLSATFVADAEEISDLIKKISDTDGAAAQEVYERFRSRLYLYQEQAHMLDPLLPGLISPLCRLLQQQAQQHVSSNNLDLQRVIAICRLLHVLVLVRGYKAVVKLLPHEAADLERVVGVLKAVKDSVGSMQSTADTAEQEERWLGVWEAQSTLLLWLSILITIPFDLATVDTTHTGQTSAGRGQPYTKLVADVLQLCRDYLSHPGSVRDMSALLLGRLLTRPDQGAALLDFLAWCQQQVQQQGPGRLDTQQAAFLIPGMLRTLCMVSKLGARAELLPHAPSMWHLLSELSGCSQLRSNVLSRKLAVKLCARLGTTFLPPRLAAWRYTRHLHLLGEQRQGGAQGQEGEEEGEAPGSRHSHAGGEREPVQGEREEGDEEEFEVVEEVEEIIERLLGGLRDGDTLVRWSAAKGAARIAGCLPAELGDEVVASVLDLFKRTESDAAWHGGSLALAELARRGLLLPGRLADVVPIIQAALQYDIRRGPCSIGAHVRDGAAYVCWAFARAYAPDVLAPSVEALAGALLTMACYDREVNCRRAAAAAFQESVGRLGNFPHGIDIMQEADYFAVGQISSAYLKVGPFVASFPEYRPVLAHHLLHLKLRHWEKALRHLAAEGLALLVPHAPPFFTATALPFLLGLVLDVGLEVRHGAVVAIAQLLRALHSADVPLTTQQQAEVGGILTALEQARLYRGKGGELMREASALLIAACSDVRLPLTPEQHADVCSTVEECLKHPQPSLQAAGVSALRSYSRSHPEACSSSGRLTAATFAAHLHDANVALRRGCILGLGALPAGMLRGGGVDAIHSLCTATQIEEDAELRDVDSRINAVAALGAVCRECHSQPELRQGLMASISQQVLPALHQAMQDYSTDNRGDVGSGVREAAMQVMVDLAQLVASRPASSSSSSSSGDSSLQQLLPPIVSALLKQAVERIARVREAAVKLLSTLVGSSALAAGIPHLAQLAAALPTEEVDVEGVVSLEALGRLARLLTVEEYRPGLLEGLIASIGCIDNSLAQAASSALVDTLAAQPALLPSCAQLLLDIWRRNVRSTRLAAPLLKTLTLLCSRTEVKQAGFATASFAAQAVELVRGETRQCSDLPRLMDAADALCQLCDTSEPVWTPCMKALLQLLGSRYPKVRKHTAEQLYLQVLVLNEDGGSGGVDWDEVEGVLLGTSWDAPLAEVHESRAQLAQLLGVEIAAPKRAAADAAALQQQAATGATYQSLLDDAARGLGGY